MILSLESMDAVSALLAEGAELTASTPDPARHCLVFGLDTGGIPDRRGLDIIEACKRPESPVEINLAAFTKSFRRVRKIIAVYKEEAQHDVPRVHSDHGRGRDRALAVAGGGQ